MKIGCWNIRGFSKALKHKEVYRFLKENNIPVLGILETKLDEGRLFDIVSWKFKEWKVVHNFREYDGGRIVIFWNPLLTLVQVKERTPQAIQTSISCLISLKTFCVSFVYGLHSIVAQRSPWETLSRFGRRLNQPWLVLGDFNNADNDSFMGLVQQGWSLQVIGTKQFTLCQKLKTLKGPLKELNKKEYAHISSRAEATTKELKQQQTLLHDCATDQLNAKKNFIASLTKRDGPRTTSKEKIQDEFLSFYAGCSCLFAWGVDSVNAGLVYVKLGCRGYAREYL
ncbi:hypothetical protein M9H77_26184 [Catharanthus roseus]|uniref:Uncharacterized protein n=1 Tax=Catharanthus roseus TaxID=4058 RepID=A0ACC0AD07_CATRO|nr:hypothetical protein M9H77_26184 [Catharanthus roseus]